MDKKNNPNQGQQNPSRGTNPGRDQREQAPSRDTNPSQGRRPQDQQKRNDGSSRFPK